MSLHIFDRDARYAPSNGDVPRARLAAAMKTTSLSLSLSVCLSVCPNVSHSLLLHIVCDRYSGVRIVCDIVVCTQTVIDIVVFI